MTFLYQPDSFLLRTIRWYIFYVLSFLKFFKRELACQYGRHNDIRYYEGLMKRTVEFYKCSNCNRPLMLTSTHNGKNYRTNFMIYDLRRMEHYKNVLESRTVLIEKTWKKSKESITFDSIQAKLDKRDDYAKPISAMDYVSVRNQINFWLILKKRSEKND